MMKPNFWRWPLLALATLCIACGGDDEPVTPGKDDNEEENEVEQPAEPPVLETDIYTAAPAGTGACRDTYLTLEFKTTPSLGTSGLIRILAADGAEVDRIDMADVAAVADGVPQLVRSEEHTSELQSRFDLVCRLLLEKKKKKKKKKLKKISKILKCYHTTQLHEA
mgnify:CR=1 FL=1